LKKREEETLDLPDIEIVSAKVHEAWMESKTAQGVESRQSEKGEELMVPYEQLSEEAKELDRATVRAVYAAIRAAQGEAAG
jgi:RyR domain